MSLPLARLRPVSIMSTIVNPLSLEGLKGAEQAQAYAADAYYQASARNKASQSQATLVVKLPIHDGVADADKLGVSRTVAEVGCQLDTAAATPAILSGTWCSGRLPCLYCLTVISSIRTTPTGLFCALASVRYSCRRWLMPTTASSWKTPLVCSRMLTLSKQLQRQWVSMSVMFSSTFG